MCATEPVNCSTADMPGEGRHRDSLPAGQQTARVRGLQLGHEDSATRATDDANTADTELEEAAVEAATDEAAASATADGTSAADAACVLVTAAPIVTRRCQQRASVGRAAAASVGGRCATRRVWARRGCCFACGAARCVTPPEVR